MSVCRHEANHGQLFSDEQLRIWHDLAAKGSTLMFNGAVMETIIDEIQRARVRAEAAEQERDAALLAAEELRAAGNAMASAIQACHLSIPDGDFTRIMRAYAAWRALVPAAGEGR